MGKSGGVKGRENDVIIKSKNRFKKEVKRCVKTAEHQRTFWGCYSILAVGTVTQLYYNRPG